MTDIKTRIDTTEAKYVKRAKGIVAKYEKYSGHLMNEEPQSFCAYLVKITSGKTQSNLRQIKASCAYYAKTLDFNELSSSIENLPSEQATSKSQGNNTSSQKKKYITFEDEQKIHNYILAEIRGNDGCSYWNKPTLVFFRAGLTVGLRPSEWQSSLILDEPTDACSSLEAPILKVKNGKNTNGRSFGEYRYIGLSQLIPQDLAFIKEAVSLASTPRNSDMLDISWDVFYVAISGRLYNITKRLFPRSKRRPTLYSCRHQLIANLKSAGYSLVDIACLSGHLTDVTATEHYGKRRFGNKDGNLPVANPEDARKIKKMFGVNKTAPTPVPGM